MLESKYSLSSMPLHVAACGDFKWLQYITNGMRLIFNILHRYKLEQQELGWNIHIRYRLVVLWVNYMFEACKVACRGYIRELDTVWSIFRVFEITSKRFLKYKHQACRNMTQGSDLLLALAATVVSKTFAKAGDCNIRKRQMIVFQVWWHLESQHYFTENKMTKRMQ